MISKVIHYCWFGDKRKPKLVRECIKSWEKYLPDYEIKEWNEKNSNLSHPFVKEMYRLKKWAFVADYVRLKVIYENGGIYLDTDMMVLKSFNELLYNNCFLGAEDLNYISAGIIGAASKNKFIKDCLAKYDDLGLNLNVNFAEITIPRIITQTYRESYGFKINFEFIIANNEIKIYPPIYFYPLPFENKHDLNGYKKYIKNESFAIHLWDSSWIEYSEFHYFRNKEYIKGLKKVWLKLLSDKKLKFSYIRKLASCVKESL